MASLEPANSELDLLNDIYPINDAILSDLMIYHKLLLQWQAKTNLVAPSTLDQFWKRHIADSLQIFALHPTETQWTDIGSGGGLPGLVIGILLKDKANGTIRLVESIQKKCAFLRRVAVETKSPIEINALRIESASKQLKAANIITARALASLDKLFDLTQDALQDNRKALFHKGRDFEREIEECNGKWKFDLIVHKSKIDAESVMLEVQNVYRV